MLGDLQGMLQHVLGQTSDTMHKFEQCVTTNAASIRQLAQISAIALPVVRAICAKGKELELDGYTDAIAEHLEHATIQVLDAVRDADTAFLARTIKGQAYGVHPLVATRERIDKILERVIPYERKNAAAAYLAHVSYQAIMAALDRHYHCLNAVCKVLRDLHTEDNQPMYTAATETLGENGVILKAIFQEASETLDATNEKRVYGIRDQLLDKFTVGLEAGLEPADAVVQAFGERMVQPTIENYKLVDFNTLASPYAAMLAWKIRFNAADTLSTDFERSINKAIGPFGLAMAVAYVHHNDTFEKVRNEIRDVILDYVPTAIKALSLIAVGDEAGVEAISPDVLDAEAAVRKSWQDMVTSLSDRAFVMHMENECLDKFMDLFPDLACVCRTFDAANSKLFVSQHDARDYQRGLIEPILAKLPELLKDFVEKFDPKTHDELATFERLQSHYANAIEAGATPDNAFAGAVATWIPNPGEAKEQLKAAEKPAEITQGETPDSEG